MFFVKSLQILGFNVDFEQIIFEFGKFVVKNNYKFENLYIIAILFKFWIFEIFV